MVGPVKEPCCRLHRENFPMILVRKYSPTVNIGRQALFQPNLLRVAFGVLAGNAISRIPFSFAPQASLAH